MKRLVARELMDGPVESVDELAANLADIAFANRAFGGIAPVLHAVRRSIRHDGARTLLDVGCGSGDVPLAIVLDARRRGEQLVATLLDRSPEMLAIARGRAAGEPNVRFVPGDGMSLPFADAAFDVVTCNLALHHFEPAAARQLLRELRRVARITPLVCDLRRSRVAFVAAWVWSRAASRNRLTRHDAPLSVRRAYTPREARSLARCAGWRAPRVAAQPFFRMLLADAWTGA
jgi:SAM-dependent methyltransferase